MEFNPLAVFLWNLLYIFLVLLAHDNISDTSTFGSKNLFLDTSYRKNFPRSVISPVIAIFFRIFLWVRADAMLVAIVIPADGPSLGVARFWYMNMNVPLVKKPIINF